MTDRTVMDTLNRPIHSEGQDSQGVEVQVARPGKGETMRKKERQIRVRAGNVPALVEAFEKRGIPVGVSTEVKSTLFGGCSDPSCCPQHESVEFPEDWRTLILQASRKEIEEVFSDLRRKGAEEDADYADLRKLHGAGIPPGGCSERRWEDAFKNYWEEQRPSRMEFLIDLMREFEATPYEGDADGIELLLDFEEDFSPEERTLLEEEARELGGSISPFQHPNMKEEEKAHLSLYFLLPVEGKPCRNCGVKVNLVGVETKTHPNDVFCGDCSEKIFRLDTALGRERRMFAREEEPVPILFSKSPETVEEMPCNNCGATVNLEGEEMNIHPNDVFCGDCSEKVLRMDAALGRERRMFAREEEPVPILFSKSPETVEAALQMVSEEGPYAVVEAEYGDIEVRGTSEALTLNHHVRPEKVPPCLVELTGKEVEGVRAIGVSHFDLDTLGGVLEILGRKPYAPEFWAAAAFVDTKGPHRLQEHCELGGKTHLQLAAFWSWSQAHRTPFLKEGELVGLNSLFEEAEEELSAILVWGEREEVGRTFLEKEDELKNSTFSEEMVVKTSSGREVVVVFRKGEVFVNHLYFREDGRPADVVVGYSTKMKSVTVSTAEEGTLHCREVVQAIWGEKAGGHPGIAGSPRDLGISEYSAWRAFRRVCLEIGEVTLAVNPGCGPYVGEECVEEGVKVECIHRAVLDFHRDLVYGDDSVAFVTLRRVL